MPGSQVRGVPGHRAGHSAGAGCAGVLLLWILMLVLQKIILEHYYQPF